MKAARMLLQIREALSHLNPDEVRALAAKPVIIEVSGSTPRIEEEMENLFAVARSPRGGPMTIDVATAATTIRIVEEGMAPPAGAFVYERARPDKVISAILKQYPDLKLALARKYPAFRECVSDDIIFNVSK